MSETKAPKKSAKAKKASGTKSSAGKAVAKKAKPVNPNAKTDLVRRVTWDRFKAKKVMPEFSSGDTIGVYVRVKEGEKERVQLFRGVVIKVQGSGISRTFTVRKISAGVGVERTFPIASPIVDRVEMISKGKVRRSRLFYLRGLKGRSARLDSELYLAAEEEVTATGAADDIATETPKATSATAKTEKSN